jgi:hypothetical protein
MQRMGDSVGLNTTPSFHFRYSRYEVDDETTEAEINDWEPYSIADQLSILAKVSLSYHHRDTEPSFTLMLKDNHLITVGCTRIRTANGSKLHRFTLAMHMVSTYVRTHTHIPHALQFVLAQGAENPFEGCDFVWVPPTLV